MVIEAISYTRSGISLNPASVNYMLAYYAEKIPMKRIGKPEEVAKAILVLASEDSYYIAGTETIVDGGLVEV